jgi:glycerol-3-phosphate acyltransferase PlsY
MELSAGIPLCLCHNPTFLKRDEFYHMFTFVILFVLVYIVGSVNFAILVLKAIGKADPRTQFSGNAGTTNVYRQAGLAWAAVVLLLDLGRALTAAAISVHFLPATAVPWIGLSLVLGNRFPCFHEFHGGKGVAGFLGFTLPLAPVAAALAALLWVAIHRMVRIPFVASFFMISVLAIGMMITYNFEAVAATGTIATALLIFFNHRQNIAALLCERGKSHESS